MIVNLMPKPEIYQKEPFEVLVQPGSYKWCSCGLSNTQPFCDDAHFGTGIEPIIVKYEKEEVVYFCGCKHSGNKPFCDDTHKTL